MDSSGADCREFQACPGHHWVTSLLVTNVPRWLNGYPCSGQVLEGGEGMSPEMAQRLRGENPMLQQKMKPRHLVMIAVGTP